MAERVKCFTHVGLYRVHTTSLLSVAFFQFSTKPSKVVSQLCLFLYPVIRLYKLSSYLSTTCVHINFSKIALDHAHEQVNAVVKGEGGALGLTEHQAALRRWTVAGMEMSRMIQEFEGGTSSAEQRGHHEQKPGVQSAFPRDVVNTVSCFGEMGNPFQDESENLMAIHTRDIMGDEVVKTIRNASKIGEEGRFIDDDFVEG